MKEPKRTELEAFLISWQPTVRSPFIKWMYRRMNSLVKMMPYGTLREVALNGTFGNFRDWCNENTGDWDEKVKLSPDSSR